VSYYVQIEHNPTTKGTVHFSRSASRNVCSLGSKSTLPVLVTATTSVYCSTGVLENHRIPYDIYYSTPVVRRNTIVVLQYSTSTVHVPVTGYTV
jgi:hypothetical protein